jgi:hypothetical protein
MAETVWEQNGRNAQIHQTKGAYHAGADNMAIRGLPPPDVEVAEDNIFERRAHDNDDEATLAKLRERRLDELKEQRKAARFGGGVRQIGKDDWQREVVSASREAWVVVHLYLASNPFCDAICSSLNVLSKDQPTVKFVQIAAQFAMPPEKYHLLPSLFCYRNGALTQRLIGKEITMSGAPTAPMLEWKLAQLGVLESDMEEAPPTSSIKHASPRSRDEGLDSDAFAREDYSNAEMD